MAALEALYLQDPFWVWIALGCVFVAMSLATGAALPMWPAVASAVVAAFGLVGLRLGLLGEAAVFAIVCASLVALARVGSAADGRAPALSRKRREPAPGPAQPGRLVGRIGRTSSEFVNGVGRVWIDGAEWAAELDAGEDVLPPGLPVRIARVTGGVRLQVHPIEGAELAFTAPAPISDP